MSANPLHATTADGRRVLLKADKTWEFVNEAAGGGGASAAEKLKLSVEKLVSKKRSCLLGLRLSNDSGYFVKSLVPRFSAMLDNGDTRYQTESVEFTRIKPRRNEYKQIRFTGLSCDQIDFVRVHGGDRCTMGDLDKFGATHGECLARVGIIPSDKISMIKQYADQ